MSALPWFSGPLFGALVCAASGCSLLFDATPEAVDAGDDMQTDAAVDVDAGPQPLKRFDFENGLDGWVSATGGECQLEVDPLDNANVALCCMGTGDAMAYDIGVPGEYEVRMRLMTITAVNDNAEAFSPFFAFNDSADLGQIVEINYNANPGQRFTAVAINDGGVGNETAAYALNTWLDVRAGANTNDECRRAWLEVDGEGTSGTPTTSSSSLVLDENFAPQMRFLIAGIFRQSGNAGSQMRCFDDVEIWPVGDACQ